MKNTVDAVVERVLASGRVCAAMDADRIEGVCAEAYCEIVGRKMIFGEELDDLSDIVTAVNANLKG